MRLLALFVSAALLALLCTSPASAQTPCGLRCNFRLVNNMPEPSGPGEAYGNSGWLTAAPVVVDVSNDVSNWMGIRSAAACRATATYGELSVVASGSGNNVAGTGCFLWIDEYFGGAPQG